jgi:hypothetical protein
MTKVLIIRVINLDDKSDRGSIPKGYKGMQQ